MSSLMILVVAVIHQVQQAAISQSVMLSHTLPTCAKCVLSSTTTLPTEEAPSHTALLPSRCSHPYLTLSMLKPEDEARIDFNPFRLWYAFEWCVWPQ